MARAADEKVLGREIGGKYKVESFIGGGAMGGVYRALQKDIDKAVAVKVLHRELIVEPLFAARFKREAKAASRLDHPNSMRVLDFGEEPDGLCYIVMELIDGQNLFQIIKAEAPLARERIVDILRQVLAALAVAHDMGVVHRDLKPENILVVRSIDDEGDVTENVKVCDFGMAKISSTREDQEEKTTEKLTSHGVVVGTPEYMSPEQGKGETLDGRSDLYSVGVILYQLLTGRLPFTAESAVAVLLKHLIEEPVPPSQIVPTVDPGLEAVAMRAMRKRTEERFANAREMRSALAAAASEGRLPASASSGRLPAPRDRSSSKLSVSGGALSVTKEHALGEAQTVEVQLPVPPSPTMTELSSVQAAAPRSLRLARDMLSDPPPPPKTRSAVPFLLGVAVLGGVAYAAVSGRLPGFGALSSAPAGTTEAPSAALSVEAPGEPSAPSAAASQVSAPPVPGSAAPEMPSAWSSSSSSLAMAMASARPPSSSTTPASLVSSTIPGPTFAAPAAGMGMAPSNGAVPAPPIAEGGPSSPHDAPVPPVSATPSPSPGAAAVAPEPGAAGGPGAHVVVGAVTADKAAEADVRAALPLDRFQACYRDGLRTMHAAPGAARLHLDIDPDGSIAKASFEGIETFRGVGDCIVHAALGRKVAGVQGAAGDATISLVFKLE